MSASLPFVNPKTEKRVTRSVIYRRRVAFNPPHPLPPRRSQAKSAKLPTPNMGGSVGGWNKRFSVVQIDMLGSMDSKEGYDNVCLVTALRAHGMQVPLTKNGPFRALSDGNLWLRPLGYRLTHVPYPFLTSGKYIKWHNAHFVAVDVGEVVRVIDDSSTTSYQSIGDIGRPDEHLWYRLEATDASAPGLGRRPIMLISTADFLMRKRADALLRPSDLPAKRRATSSAHHAPTAEQVELIQRNRAIAMTTRASQLIRPTPPPGWPCVRIPPSPTTFADELHLPEVPFLSALNRHSRDCRLTFYGDTHTYLIDGGRSTLVKW